MIDIGMNLASVSYWSQQHPFIDRLKTSGQWAVTGFSGEIPLDKNGYPTAIPTGFTSVFKVVSVDPVSLPTTDRYVLTYSGDATFKMPGTKVISVEPGKIVFDFVGTGSAFALGVYGINPENPLRDMHIVRADQVSLFERGEVFNPAFLEKADHWDSHRFMDWGKTNNSTLSSWEDRTTPDSASWASGVPIEIMVRLANETKADMWYNVPAMANDEFIRKTMEYIRDHLDPSLNLTVEYSNEVWNWQFSQAKYAAAMANSLWGIQGGGSWLEYYGYRAAQVAAITKGVFGADAEGRLENTIATQTLYLGLEKHIFNGVARAGLGPVGELFESYAVTTYFGNALSGSDATNRATVLTWARSGEDGMAAAFQQMEFGGSPEFKEKSSLADLQLIYMKQKEIAAQHGLNLVAYEGGAHITASGYDPSVQPEIIAFMTKLMNDPRMGALYDRMISDFEAAGGTRLAALTDVASPSKYGDWGALSSIYDTASPRFDALVKAALAEHPGPEQQPVLNLVGNDQDNDLVGFDAADEIVGNGGNDRLTGAGGDDYLVGGTGVDEAVFSGSWLDYSVVQNGDILTLTDLREGSPDGTDRSVGVERFTFSNGTFGAEQIVNDAPAAANDEAPPVVEAGWNSEGVAVSLGNVLSNDSDADSPLGDILKVSAIKSGGVAGVVAFNEVNNARVVDGRYGTLTINAEGGYTYILDNTRPATQGLSEGQSAVEVFTYRITDAAGASSLAELTIPVVGASDTPQQAIRNGIKASFNGSLGNDLLVAAENDADGSNLFGRAGDDIILGSSFNDYLSGGDGSDVLNGGHGDDVLSGGDGDDHLIGGAGNDQLNGDAGADRMEGGAGNDLYYVDVPGDLVIELEGEGIDGVYAKIDYTLPSHVENLWLVDSALKGTGNSLSNRIVGNDLDNVLIGGAGNDLIQSGAGNDVVHGDEGDDDIRGGNGADILYGGAGNDQMRGEAGDDILIGGSGSDRMWGGAGRDHFVFQSPQEAHGDRIEDFGLGDRIDLTAIDANSALAGNQGFSFIGAGAFRGSAGELRAVRQHDGSYQISGDVDGDGLADFVMKVFTPVSLTAADFLL